MEESSRSSAMGALDPTMYEYLIGRRAIEWAFESLGLPIIKLSPWQYPYDSALMVRHDFENYIDRVNGIESSASFESARGVKGDYYFCTGALRTYGGNKDAIIAGIEEPFPTTELPLAPTTGAWQILRSRIRKRMDIGTGALTRC